MSRPILDELDRSLIQHLKRDCRTTNRALAQTLGVTEQTVASRIRRLEARQLLRVMGILRMDVRGFRHLVVMGIQTGELLPAEVAAEVCKIPEVNGLTTTFGRYELIATALARDAGDLRDLLENRVGSIRGVMDIESELVLDCVLLRTDRAMLSRPPDPSSTVRGARPSSSYIDSFDEVDDGIVVELQRDGRTSLREIGRRLDVSEGTVRSRLRRLTSRRLLKLEAVTDVEALTPGFASAWVALKVESGGVDRIAKAMASLPESGFVGITLGRFNVVGLLVAKDRAELTSVIFERVARLVGVRRVETWEQIEIYKQDNRLAPTL